MVIGYTGWDIALLLGVSALGTATAYLRQPRWKALMVAVPIPFTLANLSLGKPVGVYQVLALSALLLFFHTVRWLMRTGVPIVLAIILAVAGYIGVAGALTNLAPDTPAVFWVLLSATGVLGTALYVLLPPREEPDYRSSLPLPVKFLAIMVVIAGVLALKHWLLGFMTLFPMVGVITAYESRFSLWTTARQIPILILAMVPMLAIIYCTQHILGIPAALALGWIGHLTTLTMLTRRMWQHDALTMHDSPVHDNP